MADLLGFSEYRPDVTDITGGLTQSVNNVIPRADGYGPFPNLSAFTSALAGQCRGYFTARKVTDGTVVIFAATSTRLYKLNNTTLVWTDVSQGGSAYTTLNVDANWTFCQFNNFVIACQANANPQKFDITSDSAFSDVSGSPPKAAYCTVINRFVVLSCTANNPNRIQWSGLNDITNWTSGTGSSDFQDLPDGGIVRGVVGGELGLIISETAIRTMSFSPGSDVIFNINKVSDGVGTIAPYSITQAGERIFFLSSKGWVQTDHSGSAFNFIGQEKIDRTFLTSYDSAAPQLVIGAADPKLPVIYVIYKISATSVTYANAGLCFNYLLGRWTPFSVSCEFISSAIRPGLTLEGLDALTPGAQAITGAASAGGVIRITVGDTSAWTTGDKKTITGVTGTTEANGTWTITVVNSTHIDLQGSTFTNAYVSGGFVGGSIDTFATSLDALTSSVTSSISGVDTSHSLGFFNGTNLESTLETAEQNGKGQRVLVKGFRPITDAAVAYGSIGYREALNAMRTYTPEAAMNSYGYIASMRSARYARLKLRVPAGTVWTFSAGVEPDAQGDGFA
jgi:hypothetical protein